MRSIKSGCIIYYSGKESTESKYGKTNLGRKTLQTTAKATKDTEGLQKVREYNTTPSAAPPTYHLMVLVSLASESTTTKRRWSF